MYIVLPRKGIMLSRVNPGSSSCAASKPVQSPPYRQSNYGGRQHSSSIRAHSAGTASTNTSTSLAGHPRARRDERVVRERARAHTRGEGGLRSGVRRVLEAGLVGELFFDLGHPRKLIVGGDERASGGALGVHVLGRVRPTAGKLRRAGRHLGRAACHLLSPKAHLPLRWSHVWGSLVAKGQVVKGVPWNTESMRVEEGLLPVAIRAPRGDLWCRRDRSGLSLACT